MKHRRSPARRHKLLAGAHRNYGRCVAPRPQHSGRIQPARRILDGTVHDGHHQFAGATNVTFPNGQRNGDISHGELICDAEQLHVLTPRRAPISGGRQQRSS